jgi:hypothetical protein
MARRAFSLAALVCLLGVTAGLAGSVGAALRRP